jgi:hypothetical protein
MADEHMNSQQQTTERETVREIHSNGDGGSGIGFLLGIILIIVLLVLFFVYGLPGGDEADNDSGTNIDIELPDATVPDTSTGDNTGGDTSLY